MRSVRRLVIISFGILFLALLSSCGNMVMSIVADTLSKPGGIVFTGDDDPELIGEAMPFAIKMYDSILEQVPDHPAMLLNTGSAYVMYANVYVQTPASVLPQNEYEKKEAMLARAKKLYLRGRDMCMKGLDKRHPGFLDAFYKTDTNRMLANLTREDAPYLYWIAASWMAAYSLNGMDINLSVGVPRVYLLMNKADLLDPEYNGGSVADLLTAYYASMPQGMGGDEKLAREYYEKTIKITKGKSASPYVTLATSLSIKNQNSQEFTELLNKALEINPDENLTNRLATIITQRKAKWYLEHKSDFFLED